MPDADAVEEETEAQAQRGTGGDDLDRCLADARAEILRRCAIRVGRNDPVMAVLVAQDVFARHNARLIEAAIDGAIISLDERLDQREAQMRERLGLHLAEAARGGVHTVHAAALDQRAEFLAALRRLTERQERAAQTAAQARRGAMIAAGIALSALGAGVVFWLALF